ncbi:OmpA family protein [Pseudogemmobacter sp. W21_MBD1_M6]|uniref:OmpA family protein n=1 Tax=Pseudogemmobacter sp. W21_MBD1_M6 TaxID=3240271 RepID=UPI003F9E1E9A
MRVSSSLIVLAVFIAAGFVSFFGASFAVEAVETRSVDAIAMAMEKNDHDWVEVEADGLQVHLSGTAPNEATRFRALAIAGGIVDAARVIDKMQVEDSALIEAPKFAVEILRSGDGISLIGLIPAATDRATILDTINAVAGDTPVIDMLESADHPVPEGWDASLAFGLQSLRKLPSSKISIAADRVAITASSESIPEKKRIETELARKVPSAVELVLNIKAPRPVVTPFTLRFLIDANGAKFDACAAQSEEARDRIIKAATAAGMESKANCILGLGVPSPRWAEAVEKGILALKDMGGGSITYSDADVTLVALDTTSQATFDRVIGELETALPDVFSLHSVLPEKVKIDGTGEGSGPPEFIATRSPEGQIQLRGRLTDERVRNAVESYARARFGKDSVYAATRLDEALPDGWPVRVLAGVEALAELLSGSVIVQPDIVEVRGITGNPETNSTISRILSDKLGEAENFNIEVTYDKKLDPLLGLPTADECVEQLNAVLNQRKISFDPGAATFGADSVEPIDKLAKLMTNCSDFEMQIGGHTDSQGREEMNLDLSQQRADAVLTALMSRRVLTSALTAKGYGETVPIADNDTEDGREANRRIEFKLLTDDTAAATTTPGTDVADEPVAEGTTGTGTTDEQN